ncbi:MAG TPA: ABC transporter permease, partial [Thermoanaerobaculia bacterium]
MPPPWMPPLLARASRRHLARHPAQLAFAVVGVALGVAVVVAVDLANASAMTGFRLGARAIAGRATHQVVGGPGGLPDGLVAELARLPGVEAAPVVEGRVEAAGGPAAGRSLRLLGVDPFSEAPFRPYLARGAAAADGHGGRAKTGPDTDLAAVLGTPGAVLLSVETARELAVAPGDDLPVRVAGRDLRLPVVGLL